jgi:nucleoid-associated protein YgaU
MGIFDFVKDAGEKLFGSKAHAAEVAADNTTKAAELESFVRRVGLEVNDLGVAVDGDTATVTGAVGSQEDREKVVLLVGNTDGIARVDDQLTVRSPPRATFYTVNSGDTLSKIAKAQYGDPMKYPVIFEANRPMLSDPDKIYPGQVLRIPNLNA